MSGIFGLFNLDGQPVDREHLGAMRAGLAYWGPHGSSLWCQGNIGLGHLLLHNTPEARAETLPLRHPASGCILTAQARIDNRKELLAGYGLSQPNRECPITDGELILHAYLKWGKECVHRLIGDWAFAVWDPVERRLFLARDHYGISGIYYYHQQRFFAFASCLKGLLALSQVPRRPNLFRVAQVLTSWPGGGVETAYQDIFRLPPAHTLTVTADRVIVEHYWRMDEIPPLRLGSDEEYVEAFLDVYGEAVRCRLRSLHPVGATLSSGLDSGSVCALAAQELRAAGKRLPVFTSIPIYDTRNILPRGNGDESPLVEINKRFLGNLDVHYIRAEDVSPLAGIRRALDLHDEPGHAAGNMFWIHALMQTAQEQDIGVLLTGQCGNATISWAGGEERLWPLLLTGKWLLLIDRLNELNISPWKIIKRYFLKPIIVPIRNLTRRIPSLWREPWEKYSVINVEFARSLQLSRRMRQSGHDPLFIPLADPLQSRYRIILPGASTVGAIWAEIGAGYSLEVRDPTIDKRLMEFCLAIPDEQYRLNGQERSLIRRAMMGMLPDEVRLNTLKGLQAADLGYRLRATLPEVQAVMAELEQSALAREVLDLKKMNRVLRELQKQVNLKTTVQCGTILTRGMMAGMFLLRF
jgi:asparagine synthase (glutamine-hydrolysing)